MNHDAIDDDTLVLYHYDDGLDATTRAAIADALARSPALAARYAALQATLARADAALDVATPDAAFEDRLWQRIAPRLPAHVPTPTPGARLAAWWRANATGAIRPLAFAALFAVVFGAGLMTGRGDRTAPVPVPVPAPTTAAAAIDDAAAQRVLAAYLSRHLENTERLFLVAQNDGDDANARALAGELAQSNRVYAAAAERAGRPQLARFLRDIEPVLIELAQGEAAGADELQQEIRARDLPFKARAAARIARQPAPLPGRRTAS